VDQGEDTHLNVIEEDLEEDIVEVTVVDIVREEEDLKIEEGEAHQGAEVLTEGAFPGRDLDLLPEEGNEAILHPDLALQQRRGEVSLALQAGAEADPIVDRQDHPRSDDLYLW